MTVSKIGMDCIHSGEPVITPKNHCPLCSLDLSKERIFYEDSFFVVLRTKALKGHRERFMIVSKEHVHDISHEAFESALDIVVRIGRKLFCGSGKFIIMDSTFATINQHWHLVCTDLDPKSDDFEQILKTNWLRVINC